MSKYLILLISLLLLSFSHQATKNLVDKLFDDLYTGPIYSGYLTTKRPGDELFYIYVPCQNSTETTPLFLWLNGGPGCSSLFGMLGEIGPVVAGNYEGKFNKNEYSFHLTTNLLFIEQPAGVGFSKASDPKYKWTDDVTAENLMAGIKDFITAFPELKGKDFYVSGESYAGVYIPFLLKKILEDQSTEDKINIKGALIGNPLTYFDTDSERSMVNFGFSHGIISLETYESFNRNCPHLKDELNPEKDNTTFYDENEKLNDQLIKRNVTHKCNEIRKIIKSNFYGNDIYGIYRLCPSRIKLSPEDEEFYNYHKKYFMKNFILEKLSPKKNENLEKNEVSDNLEEEIVIWPESCLEDLTFSKFLNMPEVKDKLKVYNNSLNWTQCSGIEYEMSESWTFYSDILVKHPEIRVWVFSGTEDGVLSTLGTMRWINKLNFTVEEKWRQWKVNEQVAGYVQKYKEGLVFLTVKGAGHMVPQDQGAHSFAMMNAFINGVLP